MEENTVNTVETTEKAAKADQKTAKKEKKPSFFKGLKTEYKKIVFADKETVAKQTVAVVGHVRFHRRSDRCTGYDYEIRFKLYSLISKARVIVCQKHIGM